MIEGSCHCGAVRLTLPGLPADLGSCNCSLCRRIGGLWGYYRPDEVAVSDPDGRLAGYVQGDATLTTWHCGQCGCTTHWSPRDGTSSRWLATTSGAAPRAASSLAARSWRSARSDTDSSS